MPPSGQGVGQLGMHRNQAAAALLGHSIAQLDGVADLTARVQHHVPGQARDFAGAQTGLRRQQNDHTVAERMAAAIGEGDQIRHVSRSKNLGLFAEHVTRPKLNNKFRIDLTTDMMRLQLLFDRMY